MKRCFCLLTLICLLMGCFTAIAEESARKAIPYDTVPVELREAFEAEKADAPAKAKKAGPLSATQRGYEGYVGSKKSGSLSVKYTISDSMVSVGEKVDFNIEVSCSYYPVIYIVGGAIMNTDFSEAGEIQRQSYTVNKRSFKDGWSYTPKQPGYFNFILAVEDGLGNRVIITTNTVQVKAKDAPEQNFSNIAVDGELTVGVKLNKNKLKVGETVTATCVFNSDAAPVVYVAGWTLWDEAQNTLDEATEEGSFYATSNKSLSFTYTPEEPGELLFLLVATDGDKNAITINAPTLLVEQSNEPETEPVVPTWDEIWATVSGTKCSMKVPADADLDSNSTWILPVPGEYGSLLIHLASTHYSESFLTDMGYSLTKKKVDGVYVLIATRVKSYGTETMVQFEYAGKDYRFYTANIKGTRLKVFQRMLETMTFKTVSNPKPRLPGDADDNGSVSISDAALILQYAAGETSSINTSNAEVTGDGAVNAQDALLILQYAAGWSVTLK